MSADRSPQPVFDRARSGYVRDFNTLDVFVFNVMGFALGLALSINAPFIGSFAPNANVPAVLMLGAGLAVLNGLTYGWFGGMMPSTGGDFVFVSRSLSHRLGFLASWGFTACQVYGFAINVGWILSVGIAPAIVTIGLSNGDARLLELGKTFTNPSVIAIGSVFLIAFYFVLAYLEIGLNKIVIYALFGAALLGPILMGWSLYTHTRAEFVNTFNAFMQKYNGTVDAYALAIATAKQNGMTIDPANTWSESLRALPLGFFCFLGFTYSVYVGGEIRDPQKSQVWGILLALAFGFLVFLLCMGRYVDVVGQEFHSAVGFPAVQEKLRLPSNSMNFFSGMLATTLTYNVFMQVGNLIWFLLVPYVMLEVCVHNLVAWASDKMMPQQFLRRSERTNALWFAVLWICIIALLCVVCNYFFGFTLVGAVALAAVPFFLTGVGALYLPGQRPDIFSKAPGVTRIRFLGVTVFQIVGLLGAFGFAWVIYSSMMNPEISGGTRTRTIIVLAIVYLTGLVVYDINRARLGRQAASIGVNLAALFEEIPRD